MPMPNIFEYEDYKKYITDRIDSSTDLGRGTRRRLADYIGCQNTFITQVLSGNYHFSSEQAERVGSFFNLSNEEIEYLIILILQNRAGTKSLAKLLEKSLQEKREKELLLKNRLKMKSNMDREDIILYLSHWQYSLIHGALGLPTLRTASALATRFKLPVNTIEKVLKFLETRGLAQQRNGEFILTKKMMHFGKDEPLLPQFHRNFRNLSMTSFDQPDESDFHYSGVIACSKQDIDKIRRKLTAFLEETSKTIQNSKEEELMVMNLDWFLA